MGRPTDEEARLREEVAEAAHVLAGLGLVTAFGHVSARVGGAMLITPAADLAGVTADGLIEVPLEGPTQGPAEGAALPAGAPAGTAVTPLRPAEVESWRAVAPELLPRLWQQLRAR